MIEQVKPIRDDIAQIKRLAPGHYYCILSVMYCQKKNNLSNKETDQLMFSRLKRRNYRIAEKRYGQSREEVDSIVGEFERLFRNK